VHFGAAQGREVLAVPVIAALARRPWLWPTAVMLAGRLAPAGWWRRWPPRPWPDRAYLRFRMQTAYGDDDVDPLASPGELIDYLEWCRRMAALRRS
jgi:hypothetical protein